MSLYYSNIMWLPYYFMSIGLEENAALVSLSFALVIPFAIALYNYLSIKVSF